MATIKPKASLLFSSSTLRHKSNQGSTIHPFFTKLFKESIKQTQAQTSKSSNSKQYKANPELAKLAQLIYKGEKINAKIPPENITYEILLNEVGKNSLDLDNPIKSKEELRKEWWETWYEIITGYSKYNTDEIKGSKKNKKIKKTGGNPIEELEKIEEKILNETPAEKKDCEEAYFLFALTNARQAVLESLQKKTQLENLKGILEIKKSEGKEKKYIIDLIKASKITYPLRPLTSFFRCCSGGGGGGGGGEGGGGEGGEGEGGGDGGGE